MIIPRLRAPIVLVHGLFGFDQVRLGPWVLVDYFPGIPEALRAAGNNVFVARLSPTGSIAARAAQLKRLLDQRFPGEAVHLIAHSMGGLDSRYLISRLGMSHRVLSLTTLGTPHRGCPVADCAVRYLAAFLWPVLAYCGIPVDAFHDLSLGPCERFNQEVPDSPNVRYFSVAGRFQLSWLTPGWFLPSWLVSRREGPNDGVVSVASATYGENCEVWDGDHFSLVNWAMPFRWSSRAHPDRIADYGRLVRRLADEGL
jgi:triacylglycerol lipase